MPDRRPRTRAQAHFVRTGVILPGHGKEIAQFLKQRRRAVRGERTTPDKDERDAQASSDRDAQDSPRAGRRNNATSSFSGP